MPDTILLEYEGRFGRGRTADDIIGLVESLPPLPDVARRALRLLDDPDSTPGELASVLRRDPALASTTLRAANSAALGRAETVSELDEAIMIVGLSSLKSRLLAVTMRNWNKTFGEIERLVWEKSLSTAVAAQVISTHIGKTYQNEAHLCGLLHNLGQLVMLSHPEVRSEYPAVLRCIREREMDYAEAEREVIGFSHPLIGALVGQKWQLPVSTCNCILRHLDPFEGIETRQDEQIALTKLASATALSAGFGRPEGHPLSRDTARELALALGFSKESFETDQEVLNRQIRSLYTAEASVYTL